MEEIDKTAPYLLKPIGFVQSELKRREQCPKQGDEGAPEAWVAIEPDFVEGLDGIALGDKLVLLTWLHKSNRNVLKVHPRGDSKVSLRGVFSTRSPDRPNPVGLHRVEVVQIEGQRRFRVRPLEALDGTPIIDIKPILRKSLDD
jgi:tRNA-Thr(GGU) m(6)t(6)A37 methyltransferase TsaA